MNKYCLNQMVKDQYDIFCAVYRQFDLGLALLVKNLNS